MGTEAAKPAAEVVAAAVAPVPGTPEHDAAMVALADARMAPPAAAVAAVAAVAPTARPDHIPEKFWDAEKGVVRADDMAKSYAELAKKLGEAKPASLTIDPAAGDAAAQAAAAAAAVTKAGVDWEGLNTEYAEKGVLSAETLQKLDAGGIPRTVVDSYIAGQKALAKEYDDVAHTAAGGADQYKAMQVWAATNMKPAEVKAYNDAIISGDTGRVTLAVAGLRSQYVEANGEKPALLTGGPAPAAGGGYASQAEMTADMRNPLYKKDAAFRAKVEAKVGATTAF